MDLTGGASKLICLSAWRLVRVVPFSSFQNSLHTIELVPNLFKLMA